MQIDETGEMYVIIVANNRSVLYIAEVREASELIGRALHLWPEGTTYHTLSTDEVQRSVK